jgi:hypothetical protein
MPSGSELNLREHVLGGGSVRWDERQCVHLEIPEGPAGSYRLAQVDDYTGLGRGNFPWNAPLTLRLCARAASRDLPGTWGFGFWNDPFGMAVVRGSKLRIPTLPNAAWFFFASEPNYLSLRDDLPGKGQLAATFQSPTRMPLELGLGISLAWLVLLPASARWLRAWLRRFVHQDTHRFNLDPTVWQVYEIDWGLDRVVFRLGGQVLLETEVSPGAPLGLVIWIDNQYAYWTPDGRLGYGTLTNRESAWLQIKSLELSPA